MIDYSKKNVIVNGKVKLTEEKYGVIQIAGKASSEQNIEADKISVDGKIKINGNVNVGLDFTVSGKCKMNNLSASSVFVKGRIDANKILAKNINVYMSSDCSVNEINCNDLLIKCRNLNEVEAKIGDLILSIFDDSKSYSDRTQNSKMICDKIYANNVNLTNAEVNEIVAESAEIGDNCKINILKYSNKIHIADNSKVNSLIRI